MRVVCVCVCVRVFMYVRVWRLFFALSLLLLLAGLLFLDAVFVFDMFGFCGVVGAGVFCV